MVTNKWVILEWYIWNVPFPQQHRKMEYDRFKFGLTNWNMHYEKQHQTSNITFPSRKNLIDHKVLFFACVLYMHVLTEFRCRHLFRILWKFSVPAPQLFWWYPEQHLSSSTHYYFLSRVYSVSRMGLPQHKGSELV